MIKVLKKLSLYASLLLFTVITVLLTGCHQQTSAATPIEPPTNSGTNPEVQSPDYFQKIVDYILKEGAKSNNSAYSTVEYKVYSKRNADLPQEDESYGMITYSEETDSLILEGCFFKANPISNTTVSFVIPHKTDYTNFSYTYTASYSYTDNNYAEPITMKGSFTASDTGIPVNVPQFKLEYNHMPDTARVTNFYYSIPNAVNEAEWILDHIFSKVVEKGDAKNITYKSYFHLPTFNNPLEIKPSNNI